MSHLLLALPLLSLRECFFEFLALSGRTIHGLDKSRRFLANRTSQRSAPFHRRILPVHLLLFRLTARSLNVARHVNKTQIGVMAIEYATLE
jgi:hypothetical protein